MCPQVHVVLPNNLFFPRKLSPDRAMSTTGNAKGGSLCIRAQWPLIAKYAGLDVNAVICVRVETGSRPLRMHIRKLAAAEVADAEPVVQRVSCWAMPDGSVEMSVRARKSICLMAPNGTPHSECARAGRGCWTHAIAYCCVSNDCHLCTYNAVAYPHRTPNDLASLNATQSGLCRYICCTK